MSKFYSKSKLNKEDEQELLLDFCDIVSSIKDSNEAARFLRDLLSSSEIEMLAKRMKIAELLMDKWSYGRIKDYLKVGDGTIARVNEWLNITGDGYKLAVERLKKKRESRKLEKISASSDFESLKRKYPIYFWPELLSKEVIKNMKEKDRNKVLKELDRVKDKTELYRNIEKELRKSL